jgi:hypothetical protein
MFLITENFFKGKDFFIDQQNEVKFPPYDRELSKTVTKVGCIFQHNTLRKDI